MPDYRRWRYPGGTYFFTVTLQDRRRRLLLDHVGRLRRAFASVRDRHPFEIVAVVILPEHLHTIWTLPRGDTDFSRRWCLLKSHFSAALDADPTRSPSKHDKREKGIWQRRFYEHLIRDEADLHTHMDYIHFNPVKHGHVSRPVDWPYSSIHRYIRLGILDEHWGTAGPLPQDLDLD